MNEDLTTGTYAQAKPVPGDVLAGRFRIEAWIGSSLLDDVYRAIDETLQAPVTLKLLRPQVVTRPQAFNRFRRKLLQAREIVSPHILRVHDLIQDEGRWLIIMDAIDGDGMDQRLGWGSSPFAIEASLKITRKIALGLGAAHARGIAHTDLKPHNVLLDQAGEVHISDFGVICALVDSGVTPADALFDRSDYLSPEQIRHDTADSRSDLYALGMILYKMLTGAIPFAHRARAEILARRVFNDPIPVVQARPEVPAWVAQLVDRLLRTQPSQRLTAAEVVSAIDRRAVPPLPWSARLPDTPRAAWIGLAVLLVVAVGSSLVWWQAAVAPLQPVLVLPIERRGGDAALDDRITGLSAHLREALAQHISVIDGERTEQALRQRDVRTKVLPHLVGLRMSVPTNRVLQPRLIAEEDGAWWFQADLRVSIIDRRHINGPLAADPIAALRAGLPVLAAALTLQTTDLDLALPARAAALDAYGAALRMQWRNGPGEETVAALRRATQADPTYAFAWLALADAARIAGEEKTASAAIQHGQRVAKRAPPPVRARFKATRALLDGDAAIAVAQWHMLSKAIPDDGFAALNLARAQIADGDLDTAIDGLRALTARDRNDPRAWLELGKAAIKQGDAERAVNDYLPRALLLYRGGRDQYGEAETVNAFGIAYGNLGEMVNAEQQYQEAVKLRRKIGDRRGIAASLHNLAAVTNVRGKFEQAAGYLDEARALYTTIGNRRGLAVVENQTGLLAQRRGDFRTTLTAHRRALTIYRQIGDGYGGVRALYNIGYAHYQLGDYADAQASWRQAGRTYGRLGDASGSLRIELTFGLLAIARGRWEEARQQLLQALPVAEKRRMVEEVAFIHRYLAELELWQGHWLAAFVQMDEAEALFSQIQDPHSLLDNRLLRVQALLTTHADTAAERILDTLAPVLAAASQEHRAIATLLQAELAQRQGDVRRTAQALAEAHRLADATGIRQLQLQADLLSAKSQPGDLAKLDADTAALGHAGLRLTFLELALTQALDANDHAAAARLYYQAQRLLHDRDYLRASQLHALGAEALAAIGDIAGATSARQAAREARATSREQAEKMASRAVSLDDTNSSSLISTP